MTRTEQKLAKLKARVREIMLAAQPVERGTQMCRFDPSRLAPQAAASSLEGGGGGSSGSMGEEEEGEDEEARRIQLEYIKEKLRRDKEESERVRCCGWLASPPFFYGPRPPLLSHTSF